MIEPSNLIALDMLAWLIKDILFLKRTEQFSGICGSIIKILPFSGKKMGWLKKRKKDLKGQASNAGLREGC